MTEIIAGMGRLIRIIKAAIGPTGDTGEEDTEGDSEDNIILNPGPTSTTLEVLKPQKGLIIIDDIAINPILAFNSHRAA
jgi:hypothetical protein